MEIWKDIPDYEGLYQVSNLGRVRSLDRYVSFKRGKSFKQGLILRQTTKSNGYNAITLHKDNVKPKTFFIHRLVAQSFIPNPNNLSDINHKDEDKTNNCVNNIEWCSHKENCNYGTRNYRQSKKVINHHNLSKPVLQYTLEGKFVTEYPSCIEAYRQTKIRVNECCLGRTKHAGGYLWRFKNGE